MKRQLLWVAPIFAILLSAGGAQAQAPGGCARHEARFPALLGKAPEEVRAALQTMSGISTVRMGGPTTPMTHDYRTDRATGLIENGIVTRITCG
jgi:hypothetical protein